jgi:predicted TIM-barrel fold metal-dependent hydrolase
MFGSDWPHGEGLESPLSFTEELQGFSEADVRKIMRDNALGFLGVKAAVAA